MRTDGETVRHDEASSHYSQFCEGTENPHLYVTWPLRSVVLNIPSVFRSVLCISGSLNNYPTWFLGPRIFCPILFLIQKVHCRKGPIIFIIFC
jgi:hypothetical protein